MNPWPLPAPFDLAAWVALEAGELAVWALRTMTGNASALGPAFGPAYWLSVVGSWRLGRWGAARMRGVRQGNDAFEYAPDRRGGSWLGWAVTVIRLQVAGEAWAAALATAVGYGSCAALLVAGLAGTWLAVAFGVWVLLRAVAARRRRRAWWG